MARWDPLAVLEINVGEVHRGRLAALLTDRARIDPETGTFMLQAGVRELTADRQILVALLAQMALRLRQKTKGVTDPVPLGLTPKQIETTTGIPGGTVRPRLRGLVEGGLVVKGGEGKYYTILGHALDLIERQLEEGETTR